MLAWIEVHKLLKQKFIRATEDRHAHMVVAINTGRRGDALGLDAETAPAISGIAHFKILVLEVMHCVWQLIRSRLCHV